MSAVIMLSGPVAAGKTTVARELIEQWSGPLAYIEGDHFWQFIARPRHTDGRENVRLITRAITAAAIPFARSEHDVLLDFAIPPTFIKSAQVILRELPLHYILLRPTAETCEARAKARVQPKPADHTAYREFHVPFEGAERHTIANDEASAASVARYIRTSLDTNTFRVE